MSTHNNLKLMVFKSALELGKKVDKHLIEMYHLNKDKYSFILPIKENFFDDGHSKVEIEDSVRGDDIYLLTDIGNYSIEYKMRGLVNHASPNDLMFQLKDGIGACNCHAKSINIVMPLLYQGRQHRRNTRENLSCGMTLYELDNMSRVRSFLTFDAHDQGVEHAIHNMEFNNFFPTNTILDQLIKDLPIEELKKRGVSHIYITVTYALFTKGIDKFNEYFDKKMFDGIYTTNLTYIPKEYKKAPWLHICDCSKLVADVIYNIHNDLSISDFIHDRSEPGRVLNEKFEENGFSRKLTRR